MTLNGKVALVTGGSGDIGSAIAEHLRFNTHCKAANKKTQPSQIASLPDITHIQPSPKEIGIAQSVFRSFMSLFEQLYSLFYHCNSIVEKLCNFSCNNPSQKTALVRQLGHKFVTTKVSNYAFLGSTNPLNLIFSFPLNRGR